MRRRNERPSDEANRPKESRASVYDLESLQQVGQFPLLGRVELGRDAKKELARLPAAAQKRVARVARVLLSLANLWRDFVWLCAGTVTF